MEDTLYIEVESPHFWEKLPKSLRSVIKETDLRTRSFFLFGLPILLVITGTILALFHETPTWLMLDLVGSLLGVVTIGYGQEIRELYAIAMLEFLFKKYKNHFNIVSHSRIESDFLKARIYLDSLKAGKVSSEECQNIYDVWAAGTAQPHYFLNECKKSYNSNNLKERVFCE